MDTYPLHIHGAKSTGDFKDINSPYDGSPVAKVEKADSAAVEQALKNAESTFHNVMRTMPAYQRAEYLYEVARLISENHEELSLTIAQEGGKPLKDARVEVTRAINTTRMSGDEALALNGEQITMDRSKGTENHLAFTLREPCGPVLAVSAFNHPVNLICHQVCPAIAAGCSVVVKPASQTAISCLKIAKLFEEAGLPDGVLNVTMVSGSEAEVMVKDPRISFITFIGGEDVGWEMRKKIAPGVGLALEHGGTGTAIVHKDADLDITIPNIARAAFYHAGQVCVSTQIVNVHKDIAEEFTSRLKESVAKLVTGDPTKPETDVGPLITSRDVERIHSWVQEAVEGGATLVCGGNPMDNNCYEPTILSETNPEMKVVNCEIFGPVVAIQPYDDIEQVIAQMNSSRYSFQAAVYTKDIDLALSSARKIETKACMINESTAFRVDWMPFGGLKASGLGVGGMRYAVREMTEEKLIVTKIH